MNNAIYRSGHLQNAITIDPHNIDRVEVTFGSSSVGYGSDALGGVIHYYTKSPDLNNEEKEITIGASIVIWYLKIKKTQIILNIGDSGAQLFFQPGPADAATRSPAHAAQAKRRPRTG